MTTSQDNLFDKYEDALELASKFEENFVELGRLLRFLQDHNPNLFKGVCKETGLSPRKAYYLASLARQIEKLAIPDKRRSCGLLATEEDRQFAAQFYGTARRPRQTPSGLRPG
jgi:hypothetical protein